ncbi:MAG: VanW family protein [Patescibacteria group bacterium]|nr:VanW family protein [Patescibacteria group bacterium]
MWWVSAVVFAVVFLAGFYYWGEVSYIDKVHAGFTVGGTQISGLTELETYENIQNFLQKNNSELTIITPNKEYIYSTNDFGVTWHIQEMTNIAINYGHKGWWGKKIRQRLWLLLNPNDMPLGYSLDNERFQETLDKIVEQTNQIGQDSSLAIDRDSQEVVVVPAISGKEINKTLLATLLKKHWLAKSCGVVQAPVVETDPTLTTAMLEMVKNKINDNLAKDYILEINSKDYSINKKDLWDWLEVTKQNNGYLVRLSPQKLDDFLTEIKKQVDQEMVPAIFNMSGDRVVEFRLHKRGVNLNKDKTHDLIQKNLLESSYNLLADVNYTEPSSRLQDLNDLGITEFVARGESNFAGSPENRRHNIRVGASKFDLVLVAPQEKFSFNKILGEVDDTTGYLPELVIKGDETTPEFGGGLCQISTTTFRAVLNGGYPVDARRNHSYRVSYYEPAGTDATVYLPYPDFRFTNNTDAHILVDTWVDEENDNLYFDFYSSPLEYRVELEEPRIYNITEPPEPVFIETSELPEGEIKKIDNAHRGADALLIRHIHDLEGKKIRTDKFESHYVPWPDKYLIGVIEAPKLETDLENVLPKESAEEEITS